MIYRFVPEAVPHGLKLHVSLQFIEGRAGMEILEVPTEWAGETLTSVSALRVISSGAKMEDGATVGERVVRAAPGKRVKVTFELSKDWSGPFKHPLQFHPVLNPQYLEFTGSNALVRLKLADDDVETADFDWSQLPADWSLATSFGSGFSPADRCQTHTGPWREIEDGLYAAGDFRLRPFVIHGQPAMLAIRGDWTFSDAEAVEQIGTIVGLVRAFWKDNRFPYFLVTVAPYDQDHGSSDGSAFTNAFWMFVSKRDSIHGLLSQLAHESFHAWNPRRMGMIPQNYDGRYLPWFHEGATEYYAQLLTLRAGYLPAEKYLASVNRDLRRFPDSTDEYVRGRILALWLDGRIQEESHHRSSLDNVMFDLVREADQPETYERLLATIQRYLSADSFGELRRAVEGQGALTMPRVLPSVESCAIAERKQQSVFDLGFDLERSHASNAVAGVVKPGPAFQAGLRDGQALLGFSVTKGEPDHLASFRVRTESGEQKISFYPRGRLGAAWVYEAKDAEVCAKEAPED